MSAVYARRRLATVTALTALASAAALLTGAPAQAAPPEPVSAATARTYLGQLTEKAEGSSDGYSRDKFPHWSTQSGACNTREVVLKRDGTNVEQDSSCAATSGTWKSPYDGGTWTAAADVDIDHVVSAAPTLQRKELIGQNVSGMPATPLRTSPGAAADPGQQLEELTVVPKGSMDGYSRDKYPHWVDQGSNCNTREVVLKRDGKNVTTDSQCRAVSGTWVSPYDGATWSDPADVDIDHVVPLANSWVSGASKWTTDQRKAFANDLNNPQLLAVTDNVNQAKGDKSPDAWRPPLESNWCHYSTDWIAVKHHYKLTITGQEKAALKDMVTRC